MQNKAASSETKSFALDPFLLLRKVYDTVEQLTSPALEKMITTQRFARLNGKVMEAILLTHRATRESVSAMLHTMNFPSREDITRLGELVLQLEEKIDKLGDRLEALEADRPIRGGGVHGNDGTP
ncbi:MAG TPA: hypothetical protein PLY80_18460 [Pseudomonadota bacterium]|jgi:polyhydroxyalkanoic acid synthase PhaR subunit|nr:hypothetical protein [Pseudomonadota bacterium]